MTKDARFVPTDPMERWLDLKCPSEFDNHFCICGLYADHDGLHECVADHDCAWSDADEDKGPFIP